MRGITVWLPLMSEVRKPSASAARPAGADSCSKVSTIGCGAPSPSPSRNISAIINATFEAKGSRKKLKPAINSAPMSIVQGLTCCTKKGIASRTVKVAAANDAMTSPISDADKPTSEPCTGMAKL